MAAVHEEKRHKPRAASEELYEQLSKEHYIRLACHQCTVPSSRDLQELTYRKIPQHLCSEDKLLLQSKTEARSRDKWTLIRLRPRPYATHGHLCDFAIRGHQCPDGFNCDRAHNQSEDYVWTTSKVDLSLFIDDVRESSLLLRSFVTRVCKLYDGGFEFICKKCFSDEAIRGKKQHVVEFDCGHTGIECKLLVFRLRNEPNKVITRRTDDTIRGDFGELVSEWTRLKTTCGASDDEIYEESRRLAQPSGSANQSKPQSKPPKIVTKDNYDLPEDYADQIENGPVGLRLLETDVFDDYESVKHLLQSTRNIDNRDFIVRDGGREPYYENIPDDKMKEYLHDPGLYKRCHITLKNHDDAECRVIKTSYEAREDLVDRIDIRGRRNCGQCFSGDEVLVEILEHAGKEQKIPLGKVVWVFKHNIDCRSHVFVCSSLYHVPNLMTPIRGSAAKIRIVDSLITKKYNNQRHSLVEVFNGEFTLKHIARLPQDLHRKQILFAVKLHSWNSKNIYPLGFVTGILKSPEEPEDEIKLLNIEYQISWVNETEKFQPTSMIHSDCQGRSENTNDFAITIDFSPDPTIDSRSDPCREILNSRGTKCFDDAFTVRELEDSTHVSIGVHIADVTEHVARNSEEDKCAAEIMEDWYTSKCIRDFCHKKMFPDYIRNTCSLTESTGEKSVISVYLTVDRNSGKITEPPSYVPSKIEIMRNLFFDEAQKIINNSATGGAASTGHNGTEPWVVEKVKMLHDVAAKMRIVRLGRACHFYKTRQYDELEKYPDASMLVEELSLTANRKVAEYLAFHHPKHPLPLRRQLPPVPLHIEKWNQRYYDIRGISFYFARPEWFSGIPVSNSVQAANVVVVSNMLNKLSNDDAACAKLLKDNLLQPINNLDIITNRSTLARRIIGSEMLHPKHALAMRQWFKIQNPAEFICSSSVQEGHWLHWDLNFDSYVQFTSPLRRYLDLVVQRILKSLLLNDLNDVHPYGTQEIQELCLRSNHKHEKVKTYKHSVEEIEQVQDFRDKGSSVACTVAEFDDSGLVLSFSNLLINYRHISIRTAPILQDEKVKLTWKLRRFNTAELCSNTQQCPSYKVSRNIWDSVLEQIVTGNRNGIINEIDTIQFIEDTSGSEGERTYDRMGKMIRTFSSNINAGMNLQVQFGNYGISKDGTRELQIELLYLPNNLDFCILHNQHPVECLSSPAHGAPTKDFYSSIEHYQGIWLPILSLESATNAVLGVGDTIIVCENVPLSIASAIGPPYRVTLTLQKHFCRTHNMEFFLRKSRRVHGGRDPVQDFLCLRYNTRLTAPTMRTWVAHGLVTSFEPCNSTSIAINCCLREYNFPLPPNFSGGLPVCTVEFLMKTATDRRRETAVRKIITNNLCKNIILNNNQRHGYFAASWPHSEVEYLTEELKNKLNDEQRDAIQKALGHKFYLIHGPPGTGKTVAGVHLARCLVELNKRHDKTANTKRRQVLYCGPSNSSVDVAARKLLELFGSEIDVVRVYSQTKESEDSANPVDDIVKSRSLHRLIRQPSKTDYSDSINEYESQQQDRDGIRVWDRAAREYKKSLRKAEALELTSCDVIFCTLVTSVSRNVVSSTHVAQVIIDECGMSTEPDCLIALTSFPGIEQVVLIGDHKQLQPIVRNYDAKRLGLGKSLFERYAESKKLTMLTKQYRMHDSICRFPSHYFYDGRLVTASSSSDCPATSKPLWPAGENQRIVFCHVEGREEIQKVATADGNLFSKHNREEQEQVIRVVKYLTNDCRIPGQSIAVLSQYKAQCSKLQLLTSSLKCDVHISTVVASQGKEWDYVILSTVRSLSFNEIDLNPPKQWLSSHLGVVADPHQVNVALTRAKSGLIIIGNKYLLKAADMWQQLLAHYEKEGCLLDATHYPLNTQSLLSFAMCDHSVRKHISPASRSSRCAKLGSIGTKMPVLGPCDMSIPAHEDAGY